MTDQWRVIVWRLGRNLRFGLLTSVRGVPVLEATAVLVHVLFIITTGFLWTWSGHGYVMFEARYKNKGFVKVTFESPSKMLHV